MKKLLLSVFGIACLVATPVQADELSSSWNGFYGGGHFGYGFGDATATGEVSGEVRCGFSCWEPFTLSRTGKFDLEGIFGGAQAGYNFQNGAFVFGLEADISASDIKTSGDNALLDAGLVQLGTVSASVDWFGTARGRVGYLLDDSVMVYATGGLAFGDVTSSMGLTVACCDSVASKSDVQVGYTVGGGVEAATSNNVSVKLEYLYVDLGSQDIFSQEIPTIGILTRNVTACGRCDIAFHTVRVGVNWHFDTPLP